MSPRIPSPARKSARPSTTPLTRRSFRRPVQRQYGRRRRRAASSRLGLQPRSQGVPLDPDKAKELLTDRRLRREQSAQIHLDGLHHSARLQPGRRPPGTAIQEYWKEVGVEAEIQTEEWTQYRLDRRAGKFQFSLSGWQGDNGDPDNFLYALLGGPSEGAGNTACTTTRMSTSCSLRASRVTDQEERKTIYHQAEQLIVDDAPWVFLGYQKHQVVTRANITDFSAADLHLLLCRFQKA